MAKSTQRIIHHIVLCYNKIYKGQQLKYTAVKKKKKKKKKKLGKQS